MSKTKQRQQAALDKTVGRNNKKVAEIFTDVQKGMDRFAQEIHVLYQNQLMMSDSMDNMDIMLVVLRSLLVKKGIATNEEFDEELAKVAAIKQKLLEERQQAREKPAEAAPEENKPAGETAEVDPELVRMKQAAEEAGKEGTPKDAFIFGG